MFPKELFYLIIWRWGEHVTPQRVFGQIIRVRHHQVPTAEVSGEYKWDGADPLHDSVGLWCNLDFSINTSYHRNRLGQLISKWHRESATVMHKSIKCVSFTIYG